MKSPNKSDPNRGHLNSSEVRERAFKGVLWSYIAYCIQFLAQAVALVVLARQLSHTDFGVFALGLMIVGIGDTMFRMTFGPSIVQLKEVRDEHINVAWTSNVAASAIATVLLASGTLLFVEGDAQGSTTKLAVLVMLSSLLLNSLMSPGLLLLQRNMQTRDFVFVSTARILIRYFGAVLLAVWIKSVWALVIAFVSGFAVEMVMSYVIAGRWPRLVWDKSTFSELFRSYRWLHLKNLLRWGARYLDSFAIGAFLGVPALGIYNRALNLAALPGQQTELLRYRIFFPMFANAQNDPERLRRLVTHALNIMLLTAVPVLLLMALHGTSVVRLVLGDKWSAAGSLLSILSFGLLLRSLNDVQATALRAVGELQFEFTISLVQVGLTAVALVPCILWKGLDGAALALIIGSIAAVIVTERLMRLRIGTSIATDLASVGGSILGAGAAYGCHKLLAAWQTSIGGEIAGAVVELTAFFVVQAAIFATKRRGVLSTVWWAVIRISEKVSRRLARPVPAQAA